MSAHDTYGSGGNYHFLEYQYEQSATQPFCPVNAPGALTQSIMSSSIKMLVLPTGQVFVTNTTFSSNNPSSAYYIYTPASSIINSNWRPSITMVSNMLTRGSTGNLIQGIRFNGLSQANMFGDDFQNATNYPLVRITNTASGQVIYAKTHDPSTMAIATGVHIVSTEFDVPPNTETGQSSLVVVANGIASIAVTVTINN